MPEDPVHCFQNVVPGLGETLLCNHSQSRAFLGAIIWARVYSIASRRPRSPRSPHTLSHLHGLHSRCLCVLHLQGRGSPPPRPAGPPARLNLIFRTSSLSIYFCHCGEEQESLSSHLQLHHISIGVVDHPANLTSQGQPPSILVHPYRLLCARPPCAFL